MDRHRMGARGNATSFPLPWEAVLQQLGGLEQTPVDLPWVGRQLSDRVSILLKTRDEEDTPKAFAQNIHQATVRRQVVIDLIQGAVNRKHRAYTSVAMERVRQNAQRLPEHGVPPEIIHLIGHDNDLDKVQVQKAATPVAGRTTVEIAAKKVGETCPNAVVMERDGAGNIDITAQCIEVLRRLRKQLEPVRSRDDRRASSTTAVGARKRVPKRPARSTSARTMAAVTRKNARSAQRPDRAAHVGDGDTVNGQAMTDSNSKITSESGQDKFVMTTGNYMLDQFEP